MTVVGLQHATLDTVDAQYMPFRMTLKAMLHLHPPAIV
jgi:hypothetical protein